jgi:hypothetical protein
LPNRVSSVGRLERDPAGDIQPPVVRPKSRRFHNRGSIDGPRPQRGREPQKLSLTPGAGSLPSLRGASRCARLRARPFSAREYPRRGAPLVRLCRTGALLASQGRSRPHSAWPKKTRTHRETGARAATHPLWMGSIRSTVPLKRPSAIFRRGGDDFRKKIPRADLSAPKPVLQYASRLKRAIRRLPEKRTKISDWRLKRSKDGVE